MPLPKTLSATPSSPQGTLLQLQGLCFGYAGRSLFQGFDLVLPAGITVVLGDESAGKTTLLRLIAGDLAAQAGSLQIRGLGLSPPSQALGHQVFWIDPATCAFDAITALQFFEQQRQLYPGFLPPDAPAWETLLQGLSLTEHLTKPLYMLSTGSKRKVWLAAAFAAGATVTLLDDPFAALDKASIRCVQQQLADPAAWTDRACVLTAYAAPEGLALAQVIDLDQ